MTSFLSAALSFDGSRPDEPSIFAEKRVFNWEERDDMASVRVGFRIA